MSLADFRREMFSHPTGADSGVNAGAATHRSIPGKAQELVGSIEGCKVDKILQRNLIFLFENNLYRNVESTQGKPIYIQLNSDGLFERVIIGDRSAEGSAVIRLTPLDSKTINLCGFDAELPGSRPPTAEAIITAAGLNVARESLVLFAQALGCVFRIQDAQFLCPNPPPDDAGQAPRSSPFSSAKLLITRFRELAVDACGRDPPELFLSVNDSGDIQEITLNAPSPKEKMHHVRVVFSKNRGDDVDLSPEEVKFHFRVVIPETLIPAACTCLRDAISAFGMRFPDTYNFRFNATPYLQPEQTLSPNGRRPARFTEPLRDGMLLQLGHSLHEVQLRFTNRHGLGALGITNAVERPSGWWLVNMREPRRLHSPLPLTETFGLHSTPPGAPPVDFLTTEMASSLSPKILQGLGEYGPDAIKRHLAACSQSTTRISESVGLYAIEQGAGVPVNVFVGLQGVAVAGDEPGQNILVIISSGKQQVYTLTVPSRVVTPAKNAENDTVVIKFP